MSLIRFYNKHIGIPQRINFLSAKLSFYLNKYNYVLDLGSSNGQLAKKIQDNTNVKFIGVDKKVQKVTYLEVVEYDGLKLPFKDKTFDCVMLIDVLHHDVNPVNILKEAKRVSKKHILIKDHYFDNYFDLFILKWFDFVGNKPYGINLPYNYLNRTQWDGLFKKIKLKKLNCEYFTQRFCKHAIYRLEK